MKKTKGMVGKASIHCIVCVLFLNVSFSSIAFSQNITANFTVDNSTGCAPLTVQFNNASQNASTYLWHFDNGNTSSLSNPVNVFTSPGVYNVTLTAVSSNGSTSQLTLPITVIPKPIADFSISNLSGCQNTQVFSFINVSQYFDSCMWDFGDGTTSTQLNPDHIYTIPGVFSVTLVAYNKSMGCSDVKVRSSVITILPAPQGVITINDTASCDLQTNFQFSASVSNAAAWTWVFGDGTISTSLSTNHQYADTGFYYPALILTSTNGCIDTINASQRIHLKYNPIPVPVFSSDTVCLAELISFSLPQNSGAIYSWDMGDSVSQTGAYILHRYYNSGRFNINLTATYSNGCEQMVNVGAITILDRPIFHFWYTNYTGCAPLTINCFNNSYGNSYTWLWDFGDGSSSTQQVPNHTYMSSGVYSVSVTAVHSNGCSYSYTQGVKVTVLSPVAAFVSDVTSGCPPLTVNFNNNSSGAVSYFWDFGDGTTSTQQHPSHVYSSNGSYQVTLIATDATGCADTLVFSTPISVVQSTVNYTTPPVVNACAPYALNFSDASGASSFLWDFGDGNISTASNPYHIFNEPGIYTVSLTTTMPNGGCEQHIPNFQTFVIDGTDPGFTYTISPCPPYTVFFNDTTSNATAWQWTFGDGGSSTLQDPQHIYPGPGIYNISLAVTTPNGCTSVLQAAGGVVITGLGANATVVCIDTVSPFNAQFYANSTGATWWLWDFGDGSTSSLQNPSHVFTTPGPHSISLTVGNDSCQAVYTYPPLSFGSASGNGGGLGGPAPNIPPRVYHCAPHTIKFNNPDPYALAYQWNFGDGTTSALPSPEHVYTDSGAYLVSVYLYQASGLVDTVYYSDTIYVVKPFTDFGITTTNLCTGVVVDVSVDPSVQSVAWNFGGGAILSTASASFTYPNVNASYMISLNVTDSNGCESFVAKSFAVNAVSPLSVSSRRSCAGDSLYFDLGNVNYSQYQWNFGDNQFSSDKNPTHAYQDSGSYQVQLLVTDINGCVQTFSMSYLVEVFDPIANFSFTTTAVNCGSGAVVCVLNNLSAGSTSCFWSFGDGTTSSQINPQSHVFYMPNYNGYFDITLIAYNNICSDTMVVQNAIYSTDVLADFVYTISSQCVPSIAEFTDLSNDAISWFWNFGDGDTSTLQNPVHAYNINPSDSIVLTVLDRYGCISTKSMPAPVLTEARFGLSSYGGCKPFSVQLFDSSANASSASWLFGDGGQSLATNPIHVFQSDGYFGVTLIANSTYGCADTLFIDSLIEVNTPSALFSADSLIGCSPLLVEFEDLSENSSLWHWDFGNGSFSGNQNPSHIYTIPGVYNVSLTVENKFGCRDSFQIDSLVTVRGSLPSFSLDTLSGCAPLQVHFTNNSLGAISYHWHFGDGNMDTTLSPNHLYLNSGQFTVSLSTFDSTGCFSLFTYPTPVSVVSTPTAELSVSQTNGCVPFTIQLDHAGTDADSLVWDFGDGTITSGLLSNHTYTSPGNYIVKLIAYNLEGCTDTLIFPDTIRVFAQPIAAFSVTQTEGCMPLTVAFADSSLALEDPVYAWDFGNGQYSNSPLPNTSYSLAGLYTVTLVVTNSTGCADTLVKSDYIKVFDDLPPPAPLLNRVTVIGDHSIEINWSPVGAADLDRYTVYRYNTTSGVFDSIYSVPSVNVNPGASVVSFVDTTVFTQLSSYRYKVEAVDKCGYRQNLDSLTVHESILLNAISMGAAVDLHWSFYGGCSISGYQVFRRDYTGGSYAWIANVDAAINKFTDSTAWCPSEYSYRVVAIDVCGNSLFDSHSNNDEATPVSPIADQQVDITRATVVDDQFVLVEWLPPAIMPDAVDRYDVYRSNDSLNYYLLGTVVATQLSYSDYQAAVDYQNYYYKIVVRNSCDTDTRLGQIGTSILLQKEDVGLQNVLKWSRYADWKTGVEYYVIEKLDEFGSWIELQRVPGSVTQWEEK